MTSRRANYPTCELLTKEIVHDVHVKFQTKNKQILTGINIEDGAFIVEIHRKHVDNSVIYFKNM